VFNVDAVVQQAVKQGERPTKGKTRTHFGIYTHTTSATVWLNSRALVKQLCNTTPRHSTLSAAILDQEVRLQKLIAAKVRHTPRPKEATALLLTAPLFLLVSCVVSAMTMQIVYARKYKVPASSAVSPSLAVILFTAAKAARARDTAVKARASSEQY
jgi:hypothetical protein